MKLSALKMSNEVAPGVNGSPKLSFWNNTRIILL